MEGSSGSPRAAEQCCHKELHPGTAPSRHLMDIELMQLLRDSSMAWLLLLHQVLPGVEGRTVGVWADNNLLHIGSLLPRGRAFTTLWSGSQAPMANVTSSGLPVVYAGRWYVDVVLPGGQGWCNQWALQDVWRCFWRVDPAAGLEGEAAGLVMGGLVAAWGEGMSQGTFDSRVVTKVIVIGPVIEPSPMRCCLGFWHGLGFSQVVM